jgi:non-specific serine/threonine protein kinase
MVSAKVCYFTRNLLIKTCSEFVENGLIEVFNKNEIHSFPEIMQDRQQLGHYKIRSVIGVGGMGEVYLADDTRLNRKVALKILPAALSDDQERLARFEQEAFTASALNHPNILTVYEFGKEDGIHFLATEYVEGKTLRDKLNGGNINFYEALDIVQQMTFALSAAHAAGIIHRDIKPENVMIRPDGIVKVLDFGLAKLLGGKTEDKESHDLTRAQIKTQPGMIMGTIAYMSPEQAEGREVDAQTDIWSLGIILYEMLTGKKPFVGASMTETVISILTKEPKPISEIRTEIPLALEHIVKKLLKKEKAERYQTAKDLLYDLKSLQKRLEFEAELERSSPPDKQTYGKLQISGANITEKISIAQPNNFSAEYTPIVGRQKEIAEIRGLLQSANVRLVTMTGIGGTGKTSLAKAVARQMLTGFTDGVFFVELAAITNPELVVSTIAQPLNVKESGGKPILEVLKDYLRERQMLLVLDNFEQVVEAAPHIAELLSAANRLKILITSRILLHLSAEREYAVPPLALPDEFKDISLDELSNYEAIKLFAERAKNTKPNFALSEQNAQAIAEICHRLDGLPLAIELAAARVKFLSPQAILAKLENRLKLLTGGARDLPARQQTMRGAVEWSYDLLNKEEKCLFRHLAVFAGGFTFEAAEAVAGCGLSATVTEELISEQEIVEIEQLTIDTFDGITSLGDKSLIVSKEQPNGEIRFRMLEVVREYALELLEMRGETKAIRRSHAEYFLALAEEAAPHLQAAQAVEWLDRLEEEHDNLRAALQWLLERDMQKATRLAAAIRMFWTFHSHLTEGRGWLEAALEHRSLDASSAVRLKLLNMLGYLALTQGDYETAQKRYEEALATSRAENDLRQIALSNRGLGIVAFGKGDIKAARKYIEEALAISRELNDKYVILASLNSLGDIARTEGNNAEARPLFEEALVISKQIDYKLATSGILYNLGAVAYGEGDYKAARSHFAQAVTTSQELGDKIRISCSLDGFAALAAQRGESERAVHFAGLAENLRESIGYEIEPPERRFRDAYISELKTKMKEEEFTKAYEHGRKLKLDEAIALALD